MTKKTFKIDGMHCASCANIIEDELNDTKGVNSISVNIGNNSGKISFDEKTLSFDEIQQIISKLGFQVTENIKNHEKEFFIKFLVSFILAIPIGASMFIDIRELFGHETDLYYKSLSLIFGTIIVFGAGISFHTGFVKKLIRLHFNMDSLVSLGSLTAYFYSIWAYFNEKHFMHFLESAAFIITFILLGKYLEYKSKGKAGLAIKKLLELQAKKAVILKDGKEIEVETRQIKKGDILVLKSGDKIALDAKIIEGKANIDESMLSGESIPVHKDKGKEVFGATIVLDGFIKAKVNKDPGDTVIAKIIEMVNEAQNSKAPIQHLADKVSGIFVPIIICIAALTFIAWHYGLGENIESSLLASVAVLVIACPCALGLATPTAIMVSSGTGAKKGILIKNGEVLESSSNINVVVFDKTGTLTHGKPKATEIICFENYDKEQIISIAGSLSCQSNHPLSNAISSYAKDNKYKKIKLSEFKEISGKGIQAKSSKGVLRLGNKKMIEENDIEYNKIVYEDISKKGETPILISLEDKVVGIIGLQDTEKENASKAISKLQDQGIEVFMITGDNHLVAKAIGDRIGIKNIISEVLPNEKAEKIQEIQIAGNSVAFVGDGINDSPALTKANLGIAIGNGTDIAIESAGMVIVSGDPIKSVEALNLAKQTYKIIKQNLFWAFFYNSIMIPIAAFGMLMPVYASLAMSFSSVSVVLNSLRIKNIR